MIYICYAHQMDPSPTPKSGSALIGTVIIAVSALHGVRYENKHRNFFIFYKMYK